MDIILTRFAFQLQREIILRLPKRFRNKIAISKEGADWIIGSNDEILRYYLQGTKPHIIRPKNRKALKFNWPKAPISPQSPTSNGFFFFKEVKHPGTKPNNVIEDIEKDTPLLERLLIKAVKSIKQINI